MVQLLDLPSYNIIAIQKSFLPFGIRFWEVSIPFPETQHDLGVIVSGMLSWIMFTKACRAPQVIHHNVPLSLLVKLKRQLYLTHVGCCYQFWQPFLIKDIQSKYQ